MKTEIKNAIEAIWEVASDSQKTEAILAESAVLGYEADEEKVLFDLADYFTNFVKCDVDEDGIITIDESDPLFTELGEKVTTVEQLIDMIG